MSECVWCGKKKGLFENFSKYGFCEKCNKKLREYVIDRLDFIRSIVAKSQECYNLGHITDEIKDEIQTALEYIEELEELRPRLPFFSSSTTEYKNILIKLNDKFMSAPLLNAEFLTLKDDYEEYIPCSIFLKEEGLALKNDNNSIKTKIVPYDQISYIYINLTDCFINITLGLNFPKAYPDNFKLFEIRTPIDEALETSAFFLAIRKAMPNKAGFTAPRELFSYVSTDMPDLKHNRFLLAKELLARVGLMINYEAHSDFQDDIDRILWTCFCRTDIIKKAIELCGEPKEPEGSFVLAKAYIWLGAAYRQKAIQYITRYLELSNENDSFLFIELGSCYEGEYMYEEALTAYAKAYNNSGNATAAPYLGMARIKLKTGFIDEAIRLLKGARSDPFYSDQVNTSSVEPGGYHKVIEDTIADYEKKKAKGYVYKPRPKKREKCNI